MAKFISLCLLGASIQASFLQSIDGEAQEFMRVFLTAEMEMFSYS